MENQLTYTYDSFFIDVKTLANLIQKSGKKYTAIVAVAKGGLMLASLLAQELKIDRVDSVSIKSYRGQEKHTLELLNTLDTTLQDALIVDDIVDTGDTLKYVSERLKADSVALFYKPEKSHTKPTYHLHETSKWVVFPWEEEA